MRAAAFLSVLAVAVGASGCSLGANEELKRVVESALIPGMYAGGCEWGSSSYEYEPKSWYGCSGYLPGSLEGVESILQTRLTRDGYDVTTARDRFSIELTAVRAAATVCADLLARGFMNGRNTSPDEINPDPGEVFVDVWTAEQRNGTTGACAELPPFPEE